MSKIKEMATDMREAGETLPRLLHGNLTERPQRAAFDPFCLHRPSVRHWGSRVMLFRKHEDRVEEEGTLTLPVFVHL